MTSSSVGRRHPRRGRQQQALETRLKNSRDEIETLRGMLEEVRVESLTDPLTGIANRQHFEAMLTSGVASAHVDGSSLMLIMIDIDEFKRFNDVYGHLTGDQVLRLLGAAMGENVESTTTLARFGGEEFAIILPQANAAAAFAVRRRFGAASWRANL